MALVDLVEFHSFLPRGLGSGSVVIDLGANRGHFSEKMTARFNVTCYAVEAHPAIFRELERTSGATCFNLALHDHVGEIRLQLSENHLAASVMEGVEDGDDAVTVPCMDLESFVRHAGIRRIDLLKIDIEGAEIPMLAACSDEFLRTIPQITVEFHDFCGLTPLRDVEACLSRMKSLGFDAIRFSRVGHRDTLLINRMLMPISEAEFLFAKYVWRNVKGGLRMTRKALFGRRWGAVTTRLKIWRQVAERITGDTPEDHAVLVRAIRRSPITVWHDLDRWQFPMVDQDCSVVSRDVGRFRVRAHTDDLFHILPGQEPEVERAIRNALRSGDTFVDAGANIGYYTIVAAGIVGKRGHVIACEMMPVTAQVLREHVAINDASNVFVVEGALSDVEGQVITASYPQGKFGQASIARGSQGPVVPVKTRTLENILRDVPEVRIMKMDLEGAELGALWGLGGAISKVQSIVFENRDSPEVIRFLEEHGFSVSRIDGNNALAQRLSGWA